MRNIQDAITTIQSLLPRSDQEWSEQYKTQLYYGLRDVLTVLTEVQNADNPNYRNTVEVYAAEKRLLVNIINMMNQRLNVLGEVLQVVLSGSSINGLEVTDFNGFLEPVKELPQMSNSEYRFKIAQIHQTENAQKVFEMLESLGLSPEYRRVSLKEYVRLMGSGADAAQKAATPKITDSALTEFYLDVERSQQPYSSKIFLQKWVSKVRGAKIMITQ